MPLRSVDAVSKRVSQREATRRRIIRVAVDLLVGHGLSAVTTLQVQRLAGVSRGALLHHFPTREELVGATIEQLMAENEAATREALAQSPADGDPVDRAIRVVAKTVVRPSFVAELELWSAARTDSALRDVIRRNEQQARSDLYRVIADVFGPTVVKNPRYPLVASLTVQFLRGLAISSVLGSRSGNTDQLVTDWATIVRAILDGRLGRNGKKAND